MSVFGVDFGSRTSTIGIARKGGIDIVCNEVSKRDTASYVSLGDDQRFIGEAGFDKAVKASTNTAANVKRFIGMRADDPQLEIEKRFCYVPTSADENGRVKLDMNYDGEPVSLYPEQVLAMLMGQFRKYVSIEGKHALSAVTDCVVTVPSWYTLEQRKLVIQSCEMSGLTCMGVMNETTAALVDYGIFRGSELPEKEDDAQHVAIVDMGYAGTTVSIAKFWRGHLRVLTHAADANLGTRDVDYFLLQHFAKEIQTKYKIDVLSNKRATLRVFQACDKVKCMLSGNKVAPLNIECLMDVDVNFNKFNRSDMEESIAPLLERLGALCKRALAEAGIGEEGRKLEHVELIGGGCRIPSFKQTVETAFSQPPRFTLNAAECIGKGATIMSAMLSPLFQVRPFVTYDKPVLPIMAGFKHPNPTTTGEVAFLPEVNKIMTVLSEGDHVPKTAELTISDMRGSFDLHLFYDDTSDKTTAITRGKNLVVGTWQIGGAAASKTTNGEVKLRIKFTAGGLPNVESAWTTEQYEVEEIVQPAAPAAPAAPTSPKKTDAEAEPKKEEGGDAAAAAAAPAEGGTEGEKKSEDAAAAAPPAEPVKVKKEKTRRVDLALSPVVGVLGFHPNAVAAFAKTESEMVKRDELIIKTKEARNSLESYIFDNRGAVQETTGAQLGAFMVQADREKFVSLANKFEEWLESEEGYDAKLGDLTSRHDQLLTIGAPPHMRKKNFDDLPYHFGLFEKAAAAQRELAEKKIGKEAHITEEELRAVMAKVDALVAEVKAGVDTVINGDKTVVPATTQETLAAKLKTIESEVRAVVNKKAPPPPPPPAPKKEEEKKTDADAAPAGADAAEGEKKAAEGGGDASADAPKPAEEEGPKPPAPSDMD